MLSKLRSHHWIPLPIKKGFWKVIDFWGAHQKAWWIFVAVLTLAWLSYDIGRVTTRAELVRVGGSTEGGLTLDKVIERAKQDKGGRLIITGQNSARFIDVEGRIWEVPRFGDDLSRADFNSLREHQVRIDGGVNIQINPVQIDSEDVLLSIVIDSLVKIMFISFYVFILYLVLRHFNQGKQGRFKKIEKDAVQGLGISDIAGYDATKQEIVEFIDYLKNPERFIKVGAIPPRGILMHGPPGNGKTRMAKAIAGEAHASFIEQSASSFIMTYAGEGAKAVRKLFEEARKQVPCVIFIDEIDAIGASRDRGGHDERIQTLNALLTEMDGFSSNEGIVVIAATNRLEVLDEALIRPGRFDRKVHVPLPNLFDREQMLMWHFKHRPHQLNLHHWAEQTQGFSAADIAGLANEAAIEAARQYRDRISEQDMSTARDRILMGVKDHHRTLSEEQAQSVAIHELGHALLRLTTGGDVEKISIEPRGRALGVTLSLPGEDRLPTLEQVKKELQVLMAGRMAEQVILGKATAGAVDDLKRASEIARSAIKDFGFGRQLYYGEEGSQWVLQEVNEWLEEASKEAAKIIEQHREWMNRWTKVLQSQLEISGVDLKESLSMVPTHAP